jgi:hypothetical protein
VDNMGICDVTLWTNNDAVHASMRPVDRPLPPDLSFHRETWGDRFHRAYRLARQRVGRGFTYREVARRVSLIRKTTDVGVIRLESLRTVPPKIAQRELAACCLVVYGFNPRHFGIDETNTSTEFFDELVKLGSV